MDTPIKASGIGFTDNAEHTTGQKGTLLGCFRCGVCCIKYQVRLSTVEAKRIAEYLGFSFDLFLERCVDHRWPGQGSLLRQVNGSCVFLDCDPNGRQNNCRIQPVKPEACRDWVSGLYRPECREGLIRYWQLTVNASGQLEGSEEKLGEFQSFLRSLVTAERPESDS